MFYYKQTNIFNQKEQQRSTNDMNLLGFFFIVTVVNVHLRSLEVCRAESQPYSINLETNLRESLLANYSVLQRPKQSVKVQVTFNLMALNDLNIKEQTMSTSGYFQLQWNDSRLDWSSDTTYSSIKFIFSTEVHMWRPTVVVENAVKDWKVLGDESILMRVVSTGKASWTPGGIYVTSCNADSTYFPFDTQSCVLILSTWAYTGNDVEFQEPDRTVDVSHYSEDGEWDLQTYTGKVAFVSRESQSFSRMTFTLTFRRRPLFHILNTILPVIMVSLLMISVFKLPAESGERIGLSLTILLAYAVYLTLISDNIPRTSLTTSILSVYLILILLYSTLSVFFTTLVLSLHFAHEDKKVPGWLRQLTKVVLVRITCRSCSGSTGRKVCPGDNRQLYKQQGVVQQLTRGGGKDDQEKKERITSISDDESFDKIYNWRDIADMADTCCLYSYLILVSLTTLICMSLLVVNY